MIAEHGGQAFGGLSNTCLTALKVAIEFAMTPEIKAKKSKQT